MGVGEPGAVLMRHRLHSICPYFAMFPEGFVADWLERVTKPGDLVADPFCGRGTAPFQALLMGRRAFAMDINPVAYCVTKAKTNAPPLTRVLRRLDELEAGFDSDWRLPGDLPDFFDHCFHDETLRIVDYLRRTVDWRNSVVDAMVAALVLGSLHGEMDKSSSYLSNQMPRTISTKPAYSIRFWQRNKLLAPRREVFTLLRRAAEFRYVTGRPRRRGAVVLNDVRTLSRYSEIRGRVDCVITSPPYLDTTNFEEDQWLRLWFLGGPPSPRKGIVSRDDRHESPARYWAFIGAMWRALGEVVRPRGHVVVRLGARGIDPGELSQKLLAAAMFSDRAVRLQASEVSEIRNRQTDHFRPGSAGCRVEVDCHFVMN